MAKIFRGRFKAGLAIGAQKDMAHNLNMLMDIIEGVEGAGSVRITKVGKDFRVISDADPNATGSGGVPTGYTKQNRVTQLQWDSSYHKLQFKKGNVLVEDGSEDAAWTDLLTFAEHDA